MFLLAPGTAFLSGEPQEKINKALLGGPHDVTASALLFLYFFATMATEY
jgi:hypothetical protein